MANSLVPYKPGPFLGHRQTVQTQIRRRRTRRLIRVYTVCSQKYLFEIEKKKMKNYTRHPLNEKWTLPIDKDR